MSPHISSRNAVPTLHEPLRISVAHAAVPLPGPGLPGLARSWVGKVDTTRVQGLPRRPSFQRSVVPQVYVYTTVAERLDENHSTQICRQTLEEDAIVRKRACGCHVLSARILAGGRRCRQKWQRRYHDGVRALMPELTLCPVDECAQHDITTEDCSYVKAYGVTGMVFLPKIFSGRLAVHVVEPGCRKSGCLQAPV